MFEGSGIPYSMAVAPLTAGSSNGNNGGWGNDGGWWVLIILFALFGGWGGNGWGNGGGSGMQGALTRGDLCNEFSFNDLQNGVRNVNDSVNLGFANLNSTICHQQYDTAMLINSVTGAVNNGFSSLNSTICQQQYDTANMLNQMNMTNMQNANAANVVALQNQNALQTQIAECCCENRQGQAAIQNSILQQTCQLSNQMQNSERNITDAVNGGTRAILDYLCQEKISDLQAENQALRLSASQEKQNAYLIDQLRPTAVPAYITCSPYASAFGYPYSGYNNNGCGCGCGCGVA